MGKEKSDKWELEKNKIIKLEGANKKMEGENGERKTGKRAKEKNNGGIKRMEEKCGKGNLENGKRRKGKIGKGKIGKGE